MRLRSAGEIRASSEAAALDAAAGGLDGLGWVAGGFASAALAISSAARAVTGVAWRMAGTDKDNPAKARGGRVNAGWPAPRVGRDPAREMIAAISIVRLCRWTFAHELRLRQRGAMDVGVVIAGREGFGLGIVFTECGEVAVLAGQGAAPPAGRVARLRKGKGAD